MRTIDDVFLQEWNLNYPRAIQLETCSSCNSHCTFCPYQETSQMFPNSVMSEELFNKIIGELKQFQPQLVAPYMNNEPLLDPNLFTRIQKIRSALPNTFIDISTNGSLLTKDRSVKLLSQELLVDEIKINFPSVIKEEYERLTGMNYNRNLRNIFDFANIVENSKFKGRHRIIIVGSNHPEIDKEFWDEMSIEAKFYPKISRGGIIDTGESKKEEINSCKYEREKSWMHILSNGQAVLCCMDWYHKNILGDLNQEDIYSIWNGKKYQDIRNKIMDSQDISFICNNCEWGIKK